MNRESVETQGGEMEVWLIRHGMTRGNQERRYIGKTDEGLSEEGVRLLHRLSYPMPQRIFSSPMRRCLQTSAILFPGSPPEIIEDLREMDFGIFENRSAWEMRNDPAYQAWVDSDCEDEIPMGEQKARFQERTIRGFLSCMELCRNLGIRSAAIVAHGGTLMSVLDTFCQEKRGYYQWHAENGCGYLTEWDQKKRDAGERCLRVIRKVF